MRLLVFGGWGQLGSDLALAAHGRTRGAELGLIPSRSWEETMEWYLAARPRLPVGGAAEGSE